MSATKSTKDLKSLDKQKLTKELSHARSEHYSARMKHAQGELKETHQLRMWRRYIARLKTFIANSK